MHTTGQVEPKTNDQYQADLNVIMSGILILVTALWLIASATGTLSAMQQAVRPYLPSWFALANLLVAPFTCVLAGSRGVKFRIGFVFALLFLAQLSLIGLSADKFPIVKGFVTILLYSETFALIPKWNRRILDKGREGRALNLDQ